MKPRAPFTSWIFPSWPEQSLLLWSGFPPCLWPFCLSGPHCLPCFWMVSTLGFSIRMRAGLGIMASFVEFMLGMHMTLAPNASITLSPWLFTKP